MNKNTTQEQQIMNLADSYTLLYSFLAKSIIEHGGEEGEAALREGTRRFGRDRAVALREKHLRANVKVNMHSLFAVGADLPPDPRFRRELKELNPQERVSHTLHCPMAALWKEYGAMEEGRIYCEEFHNACYGAYAFGYTKVNLAKTQTQEGDEYCAFNVVLRPQNLPTELKPVCFTEYDPLYAGPSQEIQQAQGKPGFCTLFIKLYCHIATTAMEQLGEVGERAICLGLEGLARDAAMRLRRSARDQDKPLSYLFLEENYPLAADPEQETMWESYDRLGTKNILITHFYQVLHQELDL